MVGYSADDYLRFSADKETIYYSEPVYACEDAYVLPTNDNSEQWGVRSTDVEPSAKDADK